LALRNVAPTPAIGPEAEVVRNGSTELPNAPVDSPDFDVIGRVPAESQPGMATEPDAPAQAASVSENPAQPEVSESAPPVQEKPPAMASADDETIFTGEAIGGLVLKNAPVIEGAAPVQMPELTNVPREDAPLEDAPKESAQPEPAAHPESAEPVTPSGRLKAAAAAPLPPRRSAAAARAARAPKAAVAQDVVQAMPPQVQDVPAAAPAREPEPEFVMQQVVDALFNGWDQTEADRRR
jgi:hypothetical protein